MPRSHFKTILVEVQVVRIVATYPLPAVNSPRSIARAEVSGR